MVSIKGAPRALQWINTHWNTQAPEERHYTVGFLLICAWIAESYWGEQVNRWARILHTNHNIENTMCITLINYVWRYLVSQPEVNRFVATLLTNYTKLLGRKNHNKSEFITEVGHQSSQPLHYSNKWNFTQRCAKLQNMKELSILDKYILKTYKNKFLIHYAHVYKNVTTSNFIKKNH